MIRGQALAPMSPSSHADPAVPRVTTRPPHGCALLLMDLFRSYLHQQRLPLTRQREVIAMGLFESGEQLSVDDLADLLRGRGEHVGKATIYRTLSLLVQAELARELDFGEGFKRYELQAGEARHDHFICTSCGQVTRFVRSVVDEFQATIAAELGYTVQSRRLEIYGLCSECRAAVERASSAGAVTTGEAASSGQVRGEGG